MYESPRIRRLRNDLAALERLRSESSVFRFSSQGDPPQLYRVQFQGRGLWRDHGKVRVLERHHVEIKLGSSYPRTIPEIRWLTPVYHPNISEIGMVCLGGYGTHWVPSVQLDELCTMLWDMLRYHNYDIRSPYNRDAALWVAQQQAYRFPTDERSLRDLRAALGRVPSAGSATSASEAASVRSPLESESRSRRALSRARSLAKRYGRVFGAADDERERRTTSPPPLPSNSELGDLVAAQSAASRRPGNDDEPVFIIEPEPAEPRRPSEPRPDTVNVAAEIRRLTAGREPTAPPGADDIVFIE